MLDCIIFGVLCLSEDSAIGNCTLKKNKFSLFIRKTS